MIQPPPTEPSIKNDSEKDKWFDIVLTLRICPNREQ